jgi:hypothetical protein
VFAANADATGWANMTDAQTVNDTTHAANRWVMNLSHHTRMRNGMRAISAEDGIDRAS